MNKPLDFKWDKEYEDELYFKIDGQIFTKNNKRIQYLFGEFLGAMSELRIKVKIKCKDGCIQIERIK